MNSMTGFGRAQSDRENVSLTVEIQSVNRRNFETNISLPRDWQSFEKEILKSLKSKIQRGKIGVQIQVSSESKTGALSWDEKALEETMANLKRLYDKLGVAWPPDSNALIRLISLHKNDFKLEDADLAVEWVLPVFNAALNQFIKMRSQEGTYLKEDLLKRLKFLIDSIAEVKNLSKDTVKDYKEILFQRLSQAGLDLDLNDERVLKELAIFADKSDISEELTRLDSHFEQFGETLNSSKTDAVGRKLEFILQEIHRELNTVGSKANNIEVSRLIIDSKNEIERIREQIQNVE